MDLILAEDSEGFVCKTDGGVLEYKCSRKVSWRICLVSAQNNAGLDLRAHLEMRNEWAKTENIKSIAWQ